MYNCLTVSNIWFRSYLNGLVVFPTFFNSSLNLAISKSWSEPQSAPGLDWLTVYSFSIFGYKERYQSDFSIGHLVMSVCKVASCAVEKECLLWPVHSLGIILLAFALLHLHSKAKLACYPKYLLTFYFSIPIPYNEEDIFFLVLVLGHLLGLHRTDQLLASSV